VSLLLDHVHAPAPDRPVKPLPLWQRRLTAEIATMDVSVKQIVWAWLLHQRSEHTSKAYGTDLREWLAFCAERDVDPLEVTRGHGDAYRGWLERTRGLSGRSAARKLAAVSSWYTYLVEESVLDANRFAGARRPEINRRESSTVSLTESEAQAMVRAAVDDHGRQRLRTAAVLPMLLMVGPRAAEVVSLAPASLGFEQGMRTVRIVGKGGVIRTRHLPDEASETMDAYLDSRGSAAGPLFVTARWRAMLTGEVSEMVKRIARQAGLYRPERVTPHMLRHTFATLAVARGATLREVQYALGHASVDTTEIYVDAPKRLENDPSVRVAKVLW
jgi:site-specific recombinase XerD